MCIPTAANPPHAPKSSCSSASPFHTAPTKLSTLSDDEAHKQADNTSEDAASEDGTAAAASIQHDSKITPLEGVKYLYSLALLLFSIVLVISLIFSEATKLSRDVSPYLALFVMFFTLLWLAVMEGQQAALVGLAPVVDHLVYRDSHPVAYKNTQLVYLGNNMDRYLTGRQLMVVLSVFVINLCGSPLPGTADAYFGLPDAMQQLFLGSGLAMILMTAMLGQLTTQVNASHCMIDFINNYLALFTLYFALGIEFSGVMHCAYLIQYGVALVSGEEIKSNEEPRTWVQSIFFWFRVLLSLTVLSFSLAVTLVALFQGKTTMWPNVPTWASLLSFVFLLILVGMLEAMQISFYACAKMKKDERATSFFGKKTGELISKKNNLPAFMIGRQLMVVSCFFILARVTTLDVEVGRGENIFGVSDAFQSFLNLGLHAAFLMTIMGAVVWKLAASAFPKVFFNAPFTYVLLWIGLCLEWTGICSGAWLLARILKRVMKLQYDEVYVGTPEKPVLSKDYLDEVAASRDALEEATRRLEEGRVVSLEEEKAKKGSRNDEVDDVPNDA